MIPISTYCILHYIHTPPDYLWCILHYSLQVPDPGFRKVEPGPTEPEPEL